jgi:hypothetical protein
VGVCDDGAGTRGRVDEGAGGAGGGASGHVHRAELVKHAVGVCDDGAGTRGGIDEGSRVAVGGASRHVYLQNVSNTLWAYATMGREPGKGLMRVLKGRAEALADTFNAQDVSNEMWAYGRMGREPWAGIMRVLEGKAEVLAGTFHVRDVSNTLWAYARMGREPGKQVMRALEGRAEALAGTFDAQNVSNTMWAYATMGREPGTGVMRELERRAEAVAGMFKAQEVANTLWAYAKMGRSPGIGAMSGLEGRTEALAGTFKAQDLANILWAYATMGREPGAGVLQGLEGRVEVLACWPRSVCRTFNTQNVANTLCAYATMGREPAAGLTRALEVHSKTIAGTFKQQDVSNTLWAYATMGREPEAELMGLLEERVEDLAHTFNAQGVSNTLWAYATMGRDPGKGMMRALEGRAEALAGTFEAQNAAKSLWAECVFSTFRAPEEGSRLVHSLAQLVMALGKAACFNIAELSQVHQYFVWCSVEPRLGVEAINDMWSLKEKCREEFVCDMQQPSEAQRQVSETLRHLGLSVEDEVRCPKSGYSIDILVHERSSSAGTWAVEFDGPSHFLKSRAPTGATLLKRRHLELLGHTLVSVPYFEWDGSKGTGKRVQYLKSKLERCSPSFGSASRDVEAGAHARMSSKTRNSVSGIATSQTENGDRERGRERRTQNGACARSEEMAVGWGTLSSAHLQGRERGAQNGECARSEAAKGRDAAAAASAPSPRRPGSGFCTIRDGPAAASATSEPVIVRRRSLSPRSKKFQLEMQAAREQHKGGERGNGRDRDRDADRTKDSEGRDGHGRESDGRHIWSKNNGRERDRERIEREDMRYGRSPLEGRQQGVPARELVIVRRRSSFSLRRKLHLSRLHVAEKCAIAIGMHGISLSLYLARPHLRSRPGSCQSGLMKLIARVSSCISTSPSTGSGL